MLRLIRVSSLGSVCARCFAAAGAIVRQHPLVFAAVGCAWVFASGLRAEPLPFPAASSRIAASDDAFAPATQESRRVVLGVITDARGPVAGATLRVEVSDMAIRRVVRTFRARTDAQGRYEIDISSVAASRLGIQVNAVSPLHAEGIRIEVVAREALPVNLSLELKPGRSVSGHVRDSLGRAVAGARVEVSHVPPAESEFDGFYTLLGVPAICGPLFVTARAEGFAPETRRLTPEVPTVPLMNVDFRLEPETVVHGRVLDPEGRSVEGANVSIQLPHDRFRRTTDAEGMFTLTNLPVHGREAARVLVHHPDYCYLDRGLAIPEGDTTITLELVRGATLAGRVVEPRRGVPVFGAEATVAFEDHPVPATVRTDFEGRFLLRHLPPGAAVFLVHPPSGESKARQGELLIKQNGRMLRGDIDPWPDRTASDFLGSVGDEGRVRLERRDRLSEQTADPHALPDFVHFGRVAPDGLRIEGTTLHRDGRRTGTWQATREALRRPNDHADLSGIWMWRETLEATEQEYAPCVMEIRLEAEERMDLEIVLTEGWTLRGSVHDAMDLPIAGARVGIVRWGNTAVTWPATRTEADGTFALRNLPEGTMTLLVSHPEHGRHLDRIEKPDSLAPAQPAHFVLGRTGAFPDFADGAVAGAALHAGRVKIGETAPAFSAVAFGDGSVLDSDGLRGKVILLDFWATWCGPCLMEIPYLRRLHARFAERDDFLLIGVSLDDAEEVLREFLEREQIAWPQIFDGKGWKADLARAFGVRAIPQLVLIDRHGVVRATDLRGEAAIKAVEALLTVSPETEE